MSVTPTGPISLLFKHLQNQFADGSAFQTWTGNPGDAVAAKLHAHVMAEDGEPDTPFVMITPGEDFQPVKIGEVNTYETIGSLSVYLVADVSSENADDHTDAFYEFTNDVGGILNGLKDLSGTAGYLNITSMPWTAGPWRTRKEDRKKLGDQYFLAFEVNFRGA